MPPAAAAPLDVFYRGALRARLVAPLAGTTANQLAAWHRRSILTSSFIKGRRGVPRLYSWIDYQKARALVALIEQGIQRPRLGPQIAALDAEVDEWWKLPLLAYSNYVIVPRDDAPGYTIIEKQGAMDDLIRDAPLRSEDVSADDAELAIDVIRVLRAEGPWGDSPSIESSSTWIPASRTATRSYPAVGSKRACWRNSASGAAAATNSPTASISPPSRSKPRSRSSRRSRHR